MSAPRPLQGQADAGPGIVNALSFDVEDYFHVHALSGQIDPAAWEAQPQRLAAAMQTLLELLAEHDVNATFFVLGWVAERYRGLIRELVAAGHELASHGLGHVRVDTQTPEAFCRDAMQTKALLEDIGGVEVVGYRAANFSIRSDMAWAYEVLEETGHRYSSSLYPIRHDHYGDPDAPRFPFRPRAGGELMEIPVSTLRWRGRNIPCGGGGYFRLLPYPVSRWAVGRINRADRASCVFYSHPWEYDPEQPRIDGLPWKSRFRHYVNLSLTAGRLRRLVSDFAWDRIDRVFLAEREDAAAGATWTASR